MATYLRASGDYGVKLQTPEFGSGKIKKGVGQYWLLEIFTNADWSSSKQRRRPTRFVNSNLVFAAACTQKAISLSSAESELDGVVSGCSDGILVRRPLEFLANDSKVHQFQWSDSSSATVGGQARSRQDQTFCWGMVMSARFGSGRRNSGGSVYSFQCQRCGNKIVDKETLCLLAAPSRQSRQCKLDRRSFQAD